MRRFLIALPAAAAIARKAYRRGSLTQDGAIAATAVGGAVMGGGGLSGAAALLTFFYSSSALSRHRRADKDQAAAGIVDKGETRDAAQVLANGGVAALLCLLPQSRALRAAALGALCAANADTWATEIGLLAAGQPRDVLTLRPVPKGTSGAVSLTGCAGMAAGAALLAVLARLQGPGLLLPVFLGGLAGGVGDSLLGATVQERRRCTTCGAATEQTRHRCGGATAVCGGIPGLDNDVVNALATALGAAVAGVLAR